MNWQQECGAYIPSMKVYEVVNAEYFFQRPSTSHTYVNPRACGERTTTNVEVATRKLPTWLYVPVCPRRLVIMHLLYTFARSEKEVEQLVLSETHLGMTVRGGWDGINT